MKIFKLLALTYVIFNLNSCLKTAGQIRQEQREVTKEEDSQKIVADLLVKTKTLEDQLASMQGKLEENQHNQTKDIFTKDSVDELRAQVEEQDRKIMNLEKVVKEQKGFIKNVTRTLSKISKSLAN